MLQVERRLLSAADGHNLTRNAGGQSVATSLPRDGELQERKWRREL